jgi:hypothetical protein
MTHFAILPNSHYKLENVATTTSLRERERERERERSTRFLSTIPNKNTAI